MKRSRFSVISIVYFSPDWTFVDRTFHCVLALSTHSLSSIVSESSNRRTIYYSNLKLKMCIFKVNTYKKVFLVESEHFFSKIITSFIVVYKLTRGKAVVEFTPIEWHLTSINQLTFPKYCCVSIDWCYNILELKMCIFKVQNMKNIIFSKIRTFFQKIVITEIIGRIFLSIILVMAEIICSL